MLDKIIFYLSFAKSKLDRNCKEHEKAKEEIDDYYILSINDIKRTLQIIQNREGNFGILLGEIPIKHCPMCGRKLK